MADGANTLTASAPGGFDPDAAPLQEALDDALAAGDVTTLAALPADSRAPVGRVAYQVLAGVGSRAPVEARELFRGAPSGVRYFVGSWTP